MFPSKTAPERLADGIVHAVGMAFVCVASVFLLLKAADTGDGWLLLASAVYTVAIVGSILISFAYHLLPRHDWRATLRRWDHAAIYIAISGTFSPLLVAAGTLSAYVILSVIWAFALAGVAFKLSGDNGDSRWSLISYLGLGGFAVIALPDFWAHLPRATTWLVAAGALSYTIGTLFYRRKQMPYRYPVWHSFGTVGGVSFFSAVWIAVTGLSA
jgi:hemolysin III